MSGPSARVRGWHCAIGLLIAGMLLAAGCATPNPARIASSASGRITIHGDLTTPAAHRILRETEEHIARVARFLKQAPPDQPLRVNVLAGRWSLRSYLAAHCPAQRGAGAACWQEGAGFQIAIRQRGDDLMLRFLRHELTHYVLACHFYDLPPWIDEGLAQYFAPGDAAGAVPAGKRSQIKRLPRSEQAEALEQLIVIPASERLSRRQYALAWALATLLVETDPAGLHGYLRAVKSGDTSRNTFGRCLGDSPAAFDARLRTFVRSRLDR